MARSQARLRSRVASATGLLVLPLLLCAPCLGRAAEPGGKAPLLARHRVVYSNLLAARINPLGLEDQLDIGYRYRLYSDPGALWRDAYVGLAFTPTISPAVARVGASLEVKPLAVLLLSAGYYFKAWMGSFEYLQSYGSPRAAHSDSDQDAGKDAGQNYATTGSELQLRAQVLGKVGPVVLRNDTSFFWCDADLNGADRLSYSIRIDAMVPDRGWALTNDTDLVWLSRFGLVAGLRATVVHAMYADADFAAGESTENPNTPTVRLGPLFAYVFSDKLGPRFNKPTALLIAGWWLKHRYRTGADVSQGIPYVVIGFRFEGDLWGRE